MLKEQKEGKLGSEPIRHDSTKGTLSCKFRKNKMGVVLSNGMQCNWKKNKQS